MVDVVLFEIEGVLFETRTHRRAALSAALATNGIDLAVDDELVDGTTARTAAAAVLAAGRAEHDDVSLDLIALRAERNFSTAVATSGAALRPGARAFIEQAATRARLGIVTRMARSDAQTLLRLAALEDLATVMVCADDVLETKPSPEAHRLALFRLRRQRGAEATSAIALEDGIPGIRAAKAAGVRCVAVGPLATHVAIEADAYVASLETQTLTMLDALCTPGRERVQ